MRTARRPVRYKNHISWRLQIANWARCVEWVLVLIAECCLGPMFCDDSAIFSDRRGSFKHQSAETSWNTQFLNSTAARLHTCREFVGPISQFPKVHRAGAELCFVTAPLSKMLKMYWPRQAISLSLIDFCLQLTRKSCESWTNFEALACLQLKGCGLWPAVSGLQSCRYP